LKEEACSVDAGGGYCLHVINAFEEGNRLAIDVLLLDEPVYKEYEPVPDLFPTVSACRPVRYWIDLETRQLVDTVRMAYDRSPDFPNVDQHLSGHRYNDFWMLGISAAGGTGRKFFDQLAHGSWKAGDVCDVYQVPRGEYLGGEPCFIGNPANRAEGVVICEHMRPAEGRTEFLLFDAFDVKRGPIAVLPTKYMIHGGFHTSFTTAGEP
jgi:carotenoid cleavage dioxygenase-like enzyme